MKLASFAKIFMNASRLIWMSHQPSQAAKQALAARTRASKVLSDPMLATRLMEHLVVPTFVLDAAGHVIWNRACEILTGVPGSEVIGTDNH